MKIVEPSQQEMVKIKSAGDSISVIITNTLKKELKAAIEEGGFLNAITVCNQIAQPLTETTGNNFNLKIKRTSFKYRNPLNAPDSIETLALEYFNQMISEDREIPDYYVQKVIENNKSYFCYYKPVKVEQLCLGCHGMPENMDTSVVNQLAKLYPEDRAIGYSAGDFRGLISVTIPE